jgi:isochorismate pyruvate lyase
MPLSKIRARIDELDDQIVVLLALRQDQVKHAAHHKSDADAVRAPVRRNEVMARLAQRALTHGVEPEVVAAVYTAMIDAFIQLEFREQATCQEASS